MLGFLRLLPLTPAGVARVVRRGEGLAAAREADHAGWVYWHGFLGEAAQLRLTRAGMTAAGLTYAHFPPAAP